MTKKRKAYSPTQDGQSDVCAELKEFIVRENAKCVKEIKDSNDRRLVAVEESLSFAMDSLRTISDRQHSADVDIVALRKETADLRRRLQQIELAEDRQEQEKRLVCLVFSGRSLQGLTRREDAAQLIRSVVHQYIGHSMDRSQIKALVRLRNGKVLIEFTSAGPGSDRDLLFRSKSRLRGSGLYIAESLTRRRQAMFSDLLRLKKEGVIFTAFTRSGNIMACRSRDAAPLRIASPEAVQQLAESGPVSRPVQGRTQVGGVEDAPSHSASGRELQNGGRGEDPDVAPGIDSSMEVETRGPADASSPSRGVSFPGPRNNAACSPPKQPGSSLLDCARETAV